ncbi:hypothetical protein IGB42_01914 [Andreprevotia sp. IGB-42]|uniref:hypothetical protein n=1 Tax=Andreprevotia sp. IGB-42 TaxID=2497473 RepID=UPI0013580707|nr:hypothetical protein [Andreprevotia sp. IGB-42]KAF0813563.1 hypothetical protein IGB42_01914 [Andreprevotia sp. IGB-42]
MKLLVTFCCIALLAGCATPPPPPEIPAVVCPEPEPVIAHDSAERHALNALLTFQAGLRALPVAELNRQLTELGRQDGSAPVLLRRAMLLAAIRGSGDLARAQALLDGALQSTLDEEQMFKPLAHGLKLAYGDLRRQDDAMDKLATQLREQQRRNEQLTEKLEALKTIERSLSERPAAPANK